MKSSAPSIIIPRRSFLRRLGCTGMSTWAMTSTIRDLRLMNTLMAQTTPTDYKALVCVFMNGGNDSNNWIVPTDADSYDQYAAIRGNLTLPASSLLPIYSSGTTPYVDSDQHTYGFHPACQRLQTLFNEDKLAVLFNVGTLVRPTTRANYMSANSAPYRPPQLFSHSDQITQWQTSIPDQPPLTGWGGRVADLLNSAANGSNPAISMSVSLAGANTFETGNLVSQYHVSTTGAVTLSSLRPAQLQAMKDLLSLTNANVANAQRAAFAGASSGAIQAGELLNTSIAATQLTTDAPAGPWTWSTPFPNTSLGNQLKMIARLIEAGNRPISSGGFGMKRQIFFCQIGGFDTHTSQVLVNGADDPTNPSGVHYGLLSQVSEAMFAFQRAMEQLNLANKVTAFTASDFSRTMPTNSQGSDHGWGSHQIIVGDAVMGGTTYNKLQSLVINGPDDTGLGRWIPTVAVDQYSATLARWFGVTAANDLAAIFPNLSRFPTSNLGFML